MARPRKSFHALLPLLVLCAAWLPVVACAENNVTEPVDPAVFAQQKESARKFAAGLNDPDANKVREAVHSLAEGAPLVAGPYLWQLVETGDGARRRLALEAFVRLKPRGYETRLYHAALAEPLWSLRRIAADAFVNLAGLEKAAQRFILGLDEKDARTGIPKLTLSGRIRTAQLLGHIGGPGAVATLRKLVEGEDAEVACAAAEGLALLGDLTNGAFLLSHLNHKNEELRSAVQDALKILTGKAYGFDRVQWEKWLEDFKGGKLPEQMLPAGDLTVGTAGETYQPEPYRVDPFKVPLEKVGVDFVVVFDTTGSMMRVWPEMSMSIDTVFREIQTKTPSVRMGGVRYRASDPSATATYLIQPKALTRKLPEARDFVLDASFGGGSGGLHLGIQHAISALNWRANARKVVLIVGDTTPSGSGLAKSLGMIKEGWEQDGILFNTLYVKSIHGEEQKPTYRLLSDMGGGRFYEYSKAEKHMVDWSRDKVDVRKAEMPQETYLKWLTPLEKKPPK